MPKRLPQRDPVAAYHRKAVAQRRIGLGTQCACGESRPEALIAGSNPTVCAACDRERQGEAALDDHHFAGKANSPDTIPVPVNDHRAELSEAQRNWPVETLRNPTGSPFLAAAAKMRGLIDTVSYLLRNLLWVAEMLEALDAFLVKKLGPRWWINTDLERFAPKGRPNAVKQT